MQVGGVERSALTDKLPQALLGTVEHLLVGCENLHPGPLGLATRFPSHESGTEEQVTKSTFVSAILAKLNRSSMEILSNFL